MKKSQIRQIIKEEIRRAINEQQMELPLDDFEDIKKEMEGFSGYKELPDGGFSLPAIGIMGDRLGPRYEFRDIGNQMVNVKKFDESNEKLGEKDHPTNIFKDFMDSYGS